MLLELKSKLLHLPSQGIYFRPHFRISILAVDDLRHSLLVSDEQGNDWDHERKQWNAQRHKRGPIECGKRWLNKIIH